MSQSLNQQRVIVLNGKNKSLTKFENILFRIELLLKKHLKHLIRTLMVKSTSRIYAGLLWMFSKLTANKFKNRNLIDCSNFLISINQVTFNFQTSIELLTVQILIKLWAVSLQVKAVIYLTGNRMRFNP